MRGGKRSSAWKPGESPVMKKGTKHKKTILKEKLGLKNWNGLVKYIETEGATKLIEEVKKLRGRDFVIAINSLAEYVKPKLARTEVSGPNGGAIPISNIDYKLLSDEVLQAILNAKKPSNNPGE